MAHEEIRGDAFKNGIGALRAPSSFSQDVLKHSHDRLNFWEAMHIRGKSGGRREGGTTMVMMTSAIADAGVSPTIPSVTDG